MDIRTELANRIEAIKRDIQWIEEDEGGTATTQRAMLAAYEAELDNTPVVVEEAKPGTRHALTARPKAGAAAKNQYGTFEVSYATQKQTNYIKHLMDTRDLAQADTTKIDVEELRAQVATTQVNKKAASAIIEFLLALPEAPRAVVASSSSGKPATDRQKDFVRKLLTEREGNANAESIRLALNIARQEFRLTAELMSATIETLLTIPVTTAKVPEGRYALPAEDGHFVFYSVDCPTEGKWAGYTFVKQLIGSVGDWNEQRLSRQVSDNVLARIAANVEEAARMFGVKASACSYCSSPLSNIQSRAAGYGQTCAENHGFFYPTVDQAKTILAERGEEV